ncbi:MAG: chromo domain-containing protein, partial [Gaiellaceae bacterium]
AYRVHLDNNPAAVRVTQGLVDRTSEAKRCLEAAQQRQKHYADKRRRPAEFAVGNEVLLSTRNITLKGPGTKKLMPRFIGPFKVVRRVADAAYELELPANMKIHDVFHVSLLKAYRQGDVYRPPPVEMTMDGEVEYEVEYLLHHRRSRGRWEYLVKWMHYGPEYNTWEPEGNLTHCTRILNAYKEMVRKCTGVPLYKRGRSKA